MDSQLKIIKKRVEQVGRRFLIVDITLLVCLFLMLYPSMYIDEQECVGVQSFEQIILSFLINGSLACTVFYIARFVKTKTNHKPNVCLVVLHIISVGLVQITELSWFVFYFRWCKLIEKPTQDNCTKLEALENRINYFKANIVAETYNNCVDLWFLYLLYRFNKRCQREGS